MHSIGIVIPTLNSAKHLPFCLPPLLRSHLKPKILIVDSSSNDHTVAVAKAFGVKTIVIERTCFNHGLTREMARKQLKTEFLIMMTPDAYIVDELAIEKIIEPLQKKIAAVAYGRQIAHDGAKTLESFPRDFNYPSQSHVRTLADLPKYGVYTFFCSNSFAAYSNHILDDIGGFPKVLLGEDTVVTAKLLHKGYAIAYVADAVVKHSHKYTLRQEFQRYLDTGLARCEYASLIACSQKEEKRGAIFTLALFKKLLTREPHKIPYAVIQTFVKWLGYKIGSLAFRFPKIRRHLSSQPHYWE